MDSASDSELDEPEPSARPECELDPDGRIWIGSGSAARLRDCNIPEGAILSFGYQAEQTAPRRAKRKEKRKMEPTPTPPVLEEVSATQAKDAVVAQVVDDAATSHEAVVEQPAAPPFDPMAVAQENPMLAFALAALAVVGGGAGFKLWTKMSEQRHETRMKELELEAQKAGLNGTQPPPCQAKQIETDAKLASLSSEVSELRLRLEKAEKKSAAFGDNFDADEVKNNLTKLERTVRDMKAKMPKPAPKK